MGRSIKFLEVASFEGREAGMHEVGRAASLGGCFGVEDQHIEENFHFPEGAGGGLAGESRSGGQGAGGLEETVQDMVEGCEEVGLGSTVEAAPEVGAKGGGLNVQVEEPGKGGVPGVRGGVSEDGSEKSRVGGCSRGRGVGGSDVGLECVVRTVDGISGVTGAANMKAEIKKGWGGLGME